MEQRISHCGLDCLECGAYIATKTDDDKKRAEVAQTWSEMFKMDIKPESINCTGCHSKEAPIFGHCETCRVRLCGMKKKTDNCAHCDEYPCNSISELHSFLPHAKKSLESIRRCLKS